MTETLARLLPFIAAGAFLPTWTQQNIVLLATGAPPWNSVAYVAGNATFRMLLGLAALFLLDRTMLAGLARTDAAPDPWLLLGLAAVFAALAVAALLRHGERQPGDALPKWLTAADRLPWYAAFAFGFLVVALPGIQYVYFLGGLAVISASGLGPWAQVLTLAVFVTCLESMLLAPVLVYAMWPTAAQSLIDRFKAWLARNSRLAGAVILALVALALGLRVVGELTQHWR